MKLMTNLLGNEEKRVQLFANGVSHLEARIERKEITVNETKIETNELIETRPSHLEANVVGTEVFVGMFGERRRIHQDLRLQGRRNHWRGK